VTFKRHSRNVKLIDDIVTQNTTWNPQDKDANISLTNNNLSAKVKGGTLKQLLGQQITRSMDDIGG